MAGDLKTSAYYSQVGSYYDEDAPLFEDRYWANETLQKIRNSFREETERFEFKNALEIGFGPGVDLIYFAQKFPEKEIFGIDISEGMHRHASIQIEKIGLQNVVAKVGTVEDIEKLFPDRKFDLIYVYFGALNTVENISVAAKHLKNALHPDGKLVITVINKWYLTGMLLPLLKGKMKIAFQRLKHTWGGYSTARHLASKCYTPKDIRRAFKDFKVVRKRGYSILFPAWYQDNLREKLGGLYQTLWKADKMINHTPFWSKGEYTLFVLKLR